MQRFGKNNGGYRGEAIQFSTLRPNLDQAVAGKNWIRDVIPITDDLEFLAYRRIVPSARLNIYISSGMHGDEPAGPLAAVQLLTRDLWPADASIWFCPMLNPTGLALNTRENNKGIDLNRDYRDTQTAEIKTHIAWLAQQPRFDISVCLHEDWEANGFYVYEVNPDNKPSLAPQIIEAVSKVCPIEHAATVDDWPAESGIIRPEIKPDERPKWPEALYLIMNKSPLGYTMEAPSDYPLAGRVQALVTGVKRVLELL